MEPDQAVENITQLLEQWKQMRYALRAISQWDMLNPVRTDLIGDLGWLKKLVDEAVTSVDGGAVKP